MPAIAPNIINSTCIEVEAGVHDNAQSLQNSLEEIFYRVIEPVLDRALTMCSPDEVDFIVGKIELNLSESDLNGGSSHLEACIFSQIGEQLKDFPVNEVQVTPCERSIACFSVFLESGVFPWNAREQTIRGLESTLLQFSDEDKEKFQEILVRLLHSDVQRRRLFQQFSPEFIEWVIEILSPETKALLPKIRSKFSSAIQDRELLKHIFNIMAHVATTTGSLKNDNNTKPFELSRYYFKALDAISLVSDKDITNYNEITNLDPLYSDNSDLQSVTTSSPVDTEPNNTIDAYFVVNAGVVLLHPFLLPLFKAAHLLSENNEFKNNQSREYAVLLMHYLATGLFSPEEQNTALYKVMAGLDIHYPINTTIILDSNILREAETLLESTIVHWGKLKNTSANGLRSAFLQREGKLVKEPQGWRITVEQQAVDLLLDYLPWNLSVIKFPWMQDIIYVDWA